MNENEIQIRSMRAEDWKEYEKLDEELFPDDRVNHESFQKQFTKDGFFALDVGDRLAGMLIVSRFGEDAGHLARIGVAKSMQNRGLGARLMEYALEWFRNEKISNAILYTQDHNKQAQHLYKKFGFERVGTTWHYFVPFDSLIPSGNYLCANIHENEIESVGEKYHEYLPAAQIRRFLQSEDSQVLVLKSKVGDIVGACRFTPSFPGCMPFRIDNLDTLDDFISGLQALSLLEYDYIRLTFTDNEDLAAICDKRGYKQHHRLYRMRVEISS
ncbi:MAG: GNAT family N-acetyltransferase [Candidatus Thorarchaeota archaeon]|jgi:ribosomal protein S18 acetylase RimI-like enzyme